MSPVKLAVLLQLMEMPKGELCQDALDVHQGQMIIAGPLLGVSTFIPMFAGYILQVRLTMEEGGHHHFLLRQIDGSITSVPASGFCRMTPEQEALARESFVCVPEDEDTAHGYKAIGDKDFIPGFLVRPPACA
ncbi:hypothetical protein HNP46_005764 [Pseudomonas nitritireducens]|uniref:Uncharacterized protein n=1 Tax=Pseudomonas nitroreducens TaxID=46680 RepID=A0A7W7P528_PSENT|nr:hypothetical protein [Pseudomonas nitritireducens]MBB4866857.1 hypothetical protein [Pseudomonas nitritireducens]